MKRKFPTTLVALGLIGAVSLGGLSVKASDLSESESKLQELEGSLNEANMLVKSLEGKVSDTHENIDALNEELSVIEEKTQALNQAISQATREMSDMEAEKARLQSEMESRMADMEARIVYSYENGRFNMINHLFSSKDFSSLMRAIEYCSQVQDFDNSVIDEYEKSLKALNENAKAIELKKMEMQGLTAENEDKAKAVEVIKAARVSELSKLDGELTDAKDIAAAYEAEVQVQNEVLAQIREATKAAMAAAEEAKRQALAQAEAQARKKAEEEARKKAEEEAKKQAEYLAQMEADHNALQNQEGGSMLSETPYESAPQNAESQSTVNDVSVESIEDKLEDLGLSTTSGSFVWPCPSSKRITSEYGPRESPTAGASTNHKGIDIGASTGSDIVAADSGEVILSEFSNSAGNYIIINHGLTSDGALLCSVYMHCDSRLVEKGDKVSRGEKIATVGSTGISTGPHLHFAVTLDGNYVNPHSYL